METGGVFSIPTEVWGVLFIPEWIWRQIRVPQFWLLWPEKWSLAEFRILTGNSVVLEHFPGIYSLYYHMDSLNVEEGQPLVQGDQIGELGSTGLVTGPHLHWELRVNTIPVDPMKYLERGLIDKDEIMNMIDSTIQEGR